MQVIFNDHVLVFVSYHHRRSLSFIYKTVTLMTILCLLACQKLFDLHPPVVVANTPFPSCHAVSYCKHHWGVLLLLSSVLLLSHTFETLLWRYRLFRRHQQRMCRNVDAAGFVHARSVHNRTLSLFDVYSVSIIDSSICKRMLIDAIVRYILLQSLAAMN